MWSYYGAKTNLVNLYPKPKYDIIIEPFAGSARYALRHFDHKVILIDKYAVIIKIWKWLQQCSPNDILKMPRMPKLGQSINDFAFDCEEAKLFYGFMLGCADPRPRKTTTVRKTIARPNFTNYGLQRVAKNLFKIKHWTFIEGDYTKATDQEATWFIDPPYQYGGSAYVESNKNIDYPALAEWCRNRGGQVIVCENTKADWMDFSPIKTQRGSLFTTTEAIWSNEPTAYDMRQQQLFSK